MSRRVNMLDAQQALGFMTQQAAYIERTVYETMYPDIIYPSLIPVSEEAPEWTKSITFFSTDKVGQAQWFHASATDVPKADIDRTKYEQGIEMAAIGYGYNLEEISQAAAMGITLAPDRAAAALRAYEEFVERVAFVGDTAKGWTGLINDATVTRTTAAADGTGSATTWASKTPAKVTRDINDQLTAVYTTSLQAEVADTMLIPISRFTYLANTNVEDGSGQTILDRIKASNAYTALTNRPLKIMAIRGLDTAGQGGTARAMFYRRDPNVIRLHMPMRHRFLPIWQRGPLVFDVPGIFRLGGTEIRRPVAVRYLDGI